MRIAPQSEQPSTWRHRPTGLDRRHDPALSDGQAASLIGSISGAVAAENGRIWLATKTLLTTSGLPSNLLIAKLPPRLHCPNCGEKGRSTVSIKWAEASVGRSSRSVPPRGRD
jgi:hypothetical protein